MIDILKGYLVKFGKLMLILISKNNEVRVHNK